MKFTKMHGCGNDYVYVNCLQETVENPAMLAKSISDRHIGVGSDGLILIKSSLTADFTMEMYNADGSQGEMCGNGIRCVGKYVYDYKLTDQKELSIETKAGIKKLTLFAEDGKVSKVTVDMGTPVLTPEEIPVKLGEIQGENKILAYPLAIGKDSYEVTCVSMGNPHAVVFVEDTASIPIESIGPLFEHHPAFPNRINTEFVEIVDQHTIRMRVWERGSGETMACGTGACASAVACVLNGFTQEEVLVHLLGGDLLVRYDKAKQRVFMTGEAVRVFDGEI